MTWLPCMSWLPCMLCMSRLPNYHACPNCYTCPDYHAMSWLLHVLITMITTRLDYHACPNCYTHPDYMQCPDYHTYHACPDYNQWPDYCACKISEVQKSCTNQPTHPPTYSHYSYCHCIEVHWRRYSHQDPVISRDALPFQQVGGGSDLLMELASGRTLPVHHLDSNGKGIPTSQWQERKK